MWLYSQPQGARLQNVYTWRDLYVSITFRVFFLSIDIFMTIFDDLNLFVETVRQESIPTHEKDKI